MLFTSSNNKNKTNSLLQKDSIDQKVYYGAVIFHMQQIDFTWKPKEQD